MTRRLMKYAMTNYPLFVLGTLVLALLHALIEGAGFGMLLPIIEGLQSPDNIVTTHAISTVFKDLFLFLGLPFNINILFIAGISLFFFQAVLEYYRIILTVRLAEKFEVDLRINLFGRLLNATLGYFHRKKLGDLVNGVVMESHRSSFAFNHLLNTIVSVALVCAYFFVAFLISWKLTLITAIIAFPLLFLTRGRKSIVNKGQDITHANENFQSATVEFLQGIREIKIYGLVEKIHATFVGVAGDVSRHERVLGIINARYSLIYQIIAVFFLLVLGGAGAYILKISTAEMATFLAILLRLSPGVTLLQKNRDKFLGLLPGFAATEKLVDEIEASLLVKDESATAIFVDELKSGIEFKNVSFAYHELSEALSKVDITFESGKTMAIVGSSGAGKSTLVDLIVRFYDPTRGQILVDGTDLKQIEINSWRGMIGFVSQEAFLFNDTVFQNIQYGDLQASHGAVLNAARKANAHEFIEALPGGYETIIGDRGVMLSGGQRQRLALARAILRNPSILILDEATSDLDTKSERLIQTALNEISQDRTVIIIAHRLSTVERADEIIVLDEGRIVESGDHQSLLAQQGKYAEFYNIQFAKS